LNLQGRKGETRVRGKRGEKRVRLEKKGWERHRGANTNEMLLHLGRQRRRPRPDELDSAAERLGQGDCSERKGEWER
jgi:hypothetical protein